MATPTKSNDTQEGCNPISSNCVIWQGPDIPCIKLCKGDTVSDVVAKLAEKLCTILDQLDMTNYDLSCFDPICPNPTDLQGLIQFILNKVCELSNQSSTTVDPGCPDCMVSIAPCFQERDFLGNLIVSLQLKDYVIKIGNEICTLISTITTIQTSVADLDSRVTFIEENCCNQDPAAITVPTASCLSGQTDMNIVNFAVQLETAFCAIQAKLGTPAEIYNAIGAECSGLAAAPPVNPAAVEPTMSAFPGWTVSPQTLAASYINLWTTVCDMRTAIIDLQTKLAACCSLTCADIVWSFTATGIVGSKFIEPYFTGSIPVGFNYCSGSTTPIEVTSSVGGTVTFNEDVIDSINTGTQLQLDITTAPTVSEQAIWYQVSIDLCITDGTLTCNKSRAYSFYNTNWCTLINTGIASSVANQVTVTWTSVAPNTVYVVNLYTQAGVYVSQQTFTYSSSAPRSAIFSGLTTGVIYYGVIVSTQNGYSATCQSNPITCS